VERVSAASPAIEYLFNDLSSGLDLSQLDDQARLVSLVTPYIERVPDGVLKQLMRHRLEGITGLSSDAVQPSARPAPPTGAGTPALTPLSRRLLACLLRSPEAIKAVDEEVRDAIAGHASTDLFAEIVKYVDDNPAVDRVELIGRWAGQPIGVELARLSERPPALSGEALSRELAEGLRNYVAQKARDQRLKLLSELKDAPSHDKLRTLHTLQKASGADSKGD
jgi:DNA primase